MSADIGVGEGAGARAAEDIRRAAPRGFSGGVLPGVVARYLHAVEGKILRALSFIVVVVSLAALFTLAEWPVYNAVEGILRYALGYPEFDPAAWPERMREEAAREGAWSERTREELARETAQAATLWLWTGLLAGIAGGLLCSWAARKTGLQARRFFICGFVFWLLPLALLLVYPYIRSGEKRSRYNYYALSLGLMFFILYLAVAFLGWYFFVHRFSQ